MERTVYITSVIDVDESGIMTEYTTVPIHVQPPKTSNPSVAIPNIDSSDLGDPSIIIIENRNVLDLDHRTVIVILDEWVVIETGIEGNPNISDPSSDTYIDTIVDVKIKLTIGVYRKRDSAFIEDK